MKKILGLVVMVALISGTVAFGYQKKAENPVKWTATAKKINATEYDLVFTAKLEKDWHIYSQVPAENGPLPTEFIYTKNENYELKGKTSEPAGGVNDKLWEDQGIHNVKSFLDKATFTQRIKLKGKKPFNIKVKVTYMVCKHSCISGEKEFTVNIKP